MKAGWRVKPLGEVVKLNYGKAISRDVRNEHGSVPVFGANGVMDYCETPLHSEPSIIVGRKGSAGAINRTDSPFWASDVSYYTTHDKTLIDFDYLHFQLLSMDLQSMAKGVKPGINRDEVYALHVSLPPLEEQQRIVAILDEAFEGLARARAHAEANLHNARELLERELETALDELSLKYGKTELGCVADFRNGFAFKSEKFKPSGEPIVRISNIQFGEVDATKMVYTDPSDYREDLSRYRVQPDELLIAMSGATTGKVGFNTTGKVLLQNQRVGRFCPTDRLRLSYLYFLLSTKVAEHLAISAGAAQPNLSTKQIEEIELPVPPLDIQDAFVADIETLRAAVNNLKEVYLEKLQSLSSLRQSLLQKAFAGELT